MMRHGDNPNPLLHRFDGGVLRKPNTPVVKARFRPDCRKFALFLAKSRPIARLTQKIMWNGKTLGCGAVNDD
jgi:hypothetical protein